MRVSIAKLIFVIFIVFIIQLPRYCIAQRISKTINKPLIDSNAYKIWTSVSDASISNNGEFASYIIKNSPVGSWTLILRSCLGSWEIEIREGKELVFTDDSRFAVITNSSDSVFVVKLGESNYTGFSDINYFQVFSKQNRNILVMQRTNGSERCLVLYDLFKKETRIFSSIRTFYGSDNLESMIMLQDSVSINRNIQRIKWLRFRDLEVHSIWEGEGLRSVVVDRLGSQIAFIVADSLNGNASNTCFNYNIRDRKCLRLFNDLANNLFLEMEVTDLVRFNDDGTRLLFHTVKRKSKSPIFLEIDEKVHIWSYLDKELQSVRKVKGDEVYSYLNVINVRNGDISELTEEGDIVLDDLKLDKAMVWHIDPDSDMRENSWNSAAIFEYYLISAKEGTRTLFKKLGNYQGRLSPDEKFIIFTDKSNYYSYEIASKKYRNLTAGLGMSWLNIYTGDKDSTTREIGGWLKKDAGVFIYDRYDIWLLDPAGKRPAVNVTNGYGRRHNIIFHLGLSEYSKSSISANEKLIINGVGVYSKENGFFVKDLSKVGDPEVLTFGPYVFHMPRNGNVYHKGQFPIKARNAGKYIVSRMTSSESLNYFLTTDFKVFTPLSNQYPEKSYNWYTSELYSWRTADGVELQGILYKPENFDSTKKYPLILNYYEKPSYNLNVCLLPNYSSDAINIPTYVSNGYLVFTPDVKFTIGDPLQGAYSSVISATAFLSRLHFVNEEKIGIQGFSFGGVQTYYLVANTNIFAAACAASGLTDFVSAYGSISNSGYSLQGNFEIGGQNRMGGTPWDRPDMYIKNSAVFKANCVTTPLLIMHTTNDGICPFSQALEFFTALRRLGKKTWLLEYIDQQHSLHGLSAVDFDIRMSQFFDHYLKDKPVPQWMAQGISTK